MTKILPILSWVFVLFSAACSGGHSDGQSPDTTAPAERVAEAPGVEAPLTYFQRQGQRLFLHYCAVCHGDRGAGDGFNAWNLDPRPRDLGDSAYQRAVSDAGLREVISHGGLAINKSNLMPGWKNTLSAEEIAAVAAFVRTLDDSAGTAMGPGTDSRR